MPAGSKSQPNELNKALTQVIRGKMGIRNLSITDLARESGVPRSTLSRLLNNQKDFEFGQVQKVARALNTRVSKLAAAAEGILDGKDPI